MYLGKYSYLVNIIQLFPISIGIDTIVVDSDIKEYLRQQTYEEILFNGVSNALISEDKKILDLDKCKSLKEKIQKSIDNYVLGYYKINFDGNFYINRSWLLEHKPGHWSPAHAHGNSIVSGVLYLECSPDSGDIKFYKPEGYWNNLSTGTINFPYEEYHPHNSESWSICPKSNTVFLFSSRLKHSVNVNNSNKSRVCLAFDVFVDGKFAGNEGLLDLTIMSGK